MYPEYFNAAVTKLCHIDHSDQECLATTAETERFQLLLRDLANRVSSIRRMAHCRQQIVFSYSDSNYA